MGIVGGYWEILGAVCELVGIIWMLPIVPIGLVIRSILDYHFYELYHIASCHIRSNTTTTTTIS